MTKIHFSINKQQDAENWYRSVNYERYGYNFQKFIPQEVLQKIEGKSKEEAMEVLDVMLTEMYEKYNPQNHADRLNKWWVKNGEMLFKKIEQIVGKKIPVDVIHVNITSHARCPYSSEKWWLMYCPVRYGEIKPMEESILVVMHELLHMMVHYYYEQYIKNKGLSDDEFNDLKESQTVILNIEFKEQGIYDHGYDSHKEIREKLYSFRKQNKNFDEFVDYGIEIMKTKN